ncbi:MAG TPA: hypothetical protein VKD72_17380 [Gemmataceae bacterium]|nr:hypothetical protein [Gemmataceae bacterium]
MSAMQKFAWFNLAVIALTLVAVLSLLPLLGKGALGGFGFLGLIGFGPLFFRRKPGQVLIDERDQLIQRRSWFLAYALFWVVFVLAAAVLSAVVYGQEGAVPVWVVQNSVFGGFMLVYALASVAILVQYAGGSKDAG